MMIVFVNRLCMLPLLRSYREYMVSLFVIVLKHVILPLVWLIYKVSSSEIRNAEK